MAHENQDKFCLMVKEKYPEFFKRRNILDAGSLDLNGNNRKYFENCNYLGIDIGEGKNVDAVCPVEELSLKDYNQFDVIISTEMLEHARDWDLALENMYYLLRDGGLMVITCATDGRSEHGTPNNQEWASPHTGNYYKNLSVEMFKSILDEEMFEEYSLTIDTHESDLQFVGIK